MNIAPISFGKTIKINASEVAAHEAAFLINNPNVDKCCKSVQNKLKQVFDDASKRGEAYVYTIPEEKETFILTGKESEKATEYYVDMVDDTEEMGRYYGAGHLFDISSNAAVERFQERMKSLINSTREDYEISLDFDERKSKIHKVEIIG